MGAMRAHGGKSHFKKSHRDLFIGIIYGTKRKTTTKPPLAFCSHELRRRAGPPTSSALVMLVARCEPLRGGLAHHDGRSHVRRGRSPRPYVATQGTTHRIQLLRTPGPTTSTRSVPTTSTHRACSTMCSKVLFKNKYCTSNYF
eukprot:SAG31_NODE_878_length_11297_cov_3.770714_1_plen_143_part_00